LGMSDVPGRSLFLSEEEGSRLWSIRWEQWHARVVTCQILAWDPTSFSQPQVLCPSCSKQPIFYWTVIYLSKLLLLYNWLWPSPLLSSHISHFG
jgi:hypothetical protein